MNLNLPPGSGHSAYLKLFETVVVPALEKFNPDLIIVPSGFDAGGMDPLARMLCDGETYRAMAQMIKKAAEKVCGGKLAMAHEGGYSAVHVPFCGLAVIEVLTGIDIGVKDPFQPVLEGMGGYILLPHQEQAIQDASNLLETIPV